MSEAFLKVVNMSFSASWLVLAVLGLRVLLKKAPKWVNVLLWGIVAVRLICPISIETTFSLIPSAQVISTSAILEVPVIDTGFQNLNNAINPILQQSVITVAPVKDLSLVKLLILVSSRVWLLGVAAMACYASGSYLALRCRVREAVILRDNIYRCAHADSPFVLGLFRPRIYLPFALSEQEMPHVIAHEQAHIQRKDHWWKPLGFLLLTIHWFNPLIWIAYLLLCRDIELACDEKVISALGNVQRADYTQALVSCSVSRRSIAACPLAFGEVSVKERVKNVMNYKKPGFWIVALAIAVSIAAAVFFLTDPVGPVRNPWVQEYVPGAEGIRGNVDKSKYESVSEDFAIGADRYGIAVFKDPHKAFDTFRVLYADAIVQIQTDHDLPPLSEATFELYKIYGWQTESDTAQTSFVSAFLDVYENSFTKDVPPEMNVQTAQTEKPAVKWFDYLTNYEDMYWDGRLEISLPEFPGVTFRWYPEKIEAVTEEGITPLFTGMPIWNTYFSDLTGDGLPELCATLSFGSGMIDNRVLIYDYANGASYELSNRGSMDYSLRFDDSDGQLYVDKHSYFGGGLVFSGKLVFRDNCIQLLGQKTNPEIIDISDPTRDPDFTYDAALESFFEDDINIYYFSGIYSQFVIVSYADGTTEDISSAMKSGRAFLGDLDRFGVRYWAEPRNDPAQ